MNGDGKRERERGRDLILRGAEGSASSHGALDVLRLDLEILKLLFKSVHHARNLLRMFKSDAGHPEREKESCERRAEEGEEEGDHFEVH